jgi:hypothetical protein
MLDSQVSRKIVVVVGLAAVFGAIIFEFAARNEPVGHIAQTAPRPPAAAAPATPPSNPPVSAPTLAQPTAQTAPASSSPATTTPAAAPPPAASSVGDTAKSDTRPPFEEESLTPAKPKASSPHSARRLAKTRHGDDSANTPAESALASNVNSAAEGPTNGPDGANSRSDGPPTSAATSTIPTRQEPVASDSQITADAKAQIATTAPDSNIDVTTTDGVIALAGSVPSQDVAERARQAALRVAGVKDVDASALKVSDQLR